MFVYTLQFKTRIQSAFVRDVVKRRNQYYKAKHRNIGGVLLVII